jgi:GIY-YIG catalytic domain
LKPYAIVIENFLDNGGAMPPVYIYALRDPRTQAVRYIGSTKDPKARLAGHCNAPGTAGLEQWVGDLREAEMYPKLYILEETTEEVRYNREKAWIDTFFSGRMLLNVSYSPLKGGA